MGSKPSLSKSFKLLDSILMYIGEIYKAKNADLHKLQTPVMCIEMYRWVVTNVILGLLPQKHNPGCVPSEEKC